MNLETINEIENAQETNYMDEHDKLDETNNTSHPPNRSI